MAGRFSFLSSVTSPPDLVCGVCSLLAAARPLPPPPPPPPHQQIAMLASLPLREQGRAPAAAVRGCHQVDCQVMPSGG